MYYQIVSSVNNNRNNRVESDHGTAESRLDGDGWFWRASPYARLRHVPHAIIDSAAELSYLG